MNHLDIAKLIESHRSQIASEAAHAAMQNPFWLERYGSGIAERLTLDLDANLAALIKSIRYRSPMIFDDHILWRRNQIIGFGCSTGHIREMFAHIWTAITNYAPAQAQPVIYEYISVGFQALVYSHPVAQTIAAAQDALAEDVTAATYDIHWHWQAAYGPDGRSQTLYDTWFLLDYLVDAIGQNKPDILTKRARWSRDQLVRRGLTTTHLQQLLWVLAAAIEQRAAPAGNDARRLLEACAGYIVSERESCRALLAAQDGLVAEVAPYLVSMGLAPQPEQAAMEVGWTLAYLGESIDLGDPAPLVGYTRWMHHWFASQGLPDTPQRQLYATLDGAFDRFLPHYAASDARAALHAAMQI